MRKKSYVNIGKNFLRFLLISIVMRSCVFAAELDLKAEQAFGKKGYHFGRFRRPSGITLLNRHIYVADSRNRRVKRFSLKGAFVSLFDEYEEDGEREGFESVDAVSSSPTGVLYVLDSENSLVTMFDRFGGYIDQFGAFGHSSTRYNEPSRLVCDALGDLFIVDTGNNRVVKTDERGQFILSITSKEHLLVSPIDLVSTSSGYVYI